MRFGSRENPGKMDTPDWLAAHVIKGQVISNLPELVVSRMVANKPFIACDDGRAFTHGAFWDLCGRFAAVLAALNTTVGDRVVVQVPKSVEALAVFWACARAGLVFVPLNTAYTLAEVSYFVDDAEPSVFVCDAGQHAGISAHFANLPRLRVVSFDAAGGGSLGEEAKKTMSGFVDHPTTWDDAVAILYTSGTTGRSKGAMLTHGNLASNALALIDVWQMTADDTLIHALPVYHTHGLFTATNTIMLAGGRMLFDAKFEAEAVIAKFVDATMLMGVPTFYTRLLQSDRLTKDAVRNMRLFISGSAPLLAETHQDFAARTGQAILERYGMTETSMNTSNPCQGERRAGTVGMALPYVQVRISDLASGRVIERRETGMIELKGPNLFKGYWRNPEKTAEDMTADGFFRTGDVGCFDRDGYLSITGRAKDLVITGGFNVYPKEVELLIDAMDGVLESAVIGLPHPDFGEGVTAIVVAEAGRLIKEADVIAQMKSQVAAFKLPKRVLVVEQLPRNVMGKVQKAALRETYRDLYRPV